MRTMRWETRFPFSMARSIVLNRGAGAMVSGGQVRDRRIISELSTADRSATRGILKVPRARGRDGPVVGPSLPR